MKWNDDRPLTTADRERTTNSVRRCLDEGADDVCSVALVSAHRAVECVAFRGTAASFAETADGACGHRPKSDGDEQTTRAVCWSSPRGASWRRLPLLLDCSKRARRVNAPFRFDCARSRLGGGRELLGSRRFCAIRACPGSRPACVLRRRCASPPVRFPCLPRLFALQRHVPPKML